MRTDASGNVAKEVLVAIVVLTFNAPWYCRTTLRSLRKTANARYEVVVVDNNSMWLTKCYLVWAFFRNMIDRLCLLNRNTLFAGGNNIGVKLTSHGVTHVVLLNSDVEIRDPQWLRKLLELHSTGISAYGYIAESETIPARADGYCMLIDKPLYERYWLDENFKWWWGITELQARIMNDGHPVRAVADHDHILHHFGGKSGTSHLAPDQSNFKAPAKVKDWFGRRCVEKIDRID